MALQGPKPMSTITSAAAMAAGTRSFIICISKGRASARIAERAARVRTESDSLEDAPQSERTGTPDRVSGPSGRKTIARNVSSGTPVNTRGSPGRRVREVFTPFRGSSRLSASGFPRLTPWANFFRPSGSAEPPESRVRFSLRQVSAYSARAVDWLSRLRNRIPRP